MAGSGKIRVGILGASGYTGAELLRLLHLHPHADIAFLTANRQAGQPMETVFPHLSPLRLPAPLPLEAATEQQADVIFCALPHGTTQQTVAALLQASPNTRIIDLSADFRLFDMQEYARWYGHAHQAPGIQATAVYGLTEIHRAAIAQTRLIANPGCYTTTTLLATIPPTAAGLIAAEGLIVDAKSGISGAGRAERQQYLYTETAESLHAYGVGGHRHVAEIEQELARAGNGGARPRVSFTPHLAPMSRGILATCYAQLVNGATVEDVRACLAARYADEPFVHVLAAGETPATRDVRGSNHCRIGIFPDRVPGRVILLSATDNLVKGASGQAVQNMNLLFGLPETTGLEAVALFP